MRQTRVNYFVLGVLFVISSTSDLRVRCHSHTSMSSDTDPHGRYIDEQHDFLYWDDDDDQVGDASTQVKSVRYKQNQQISDNLENDSMHHSLIQNQITTQDQQAQNKMIVQDVRNQNEQQDRWKLESIVYSEKNRQLAILEKIKRIEKFREKLHKQSYKWQEHENAASSYGNLKSDCDSSCSRTCYEQNNMTSVINTFVNCIAPQCKCLNSFALSHVPEPYFNHTDYNLHVNDTIRAFEDKFTEYWPKMIKSAVTDPDGYDLLRDCDLQCHKDCFEIKKFVPFETLLQCPRYRCNCWYKLDDYVHNQIPSSYFQPAVVQSAADWRDDILRNCNKSCANRCMHSFASKPEVEFCVQYKCGCDIQKGVGQADMIMDRLGFRATPSVVVDERAEWQKIAEKQYQITNDTIFDDEDELDAQSYANQQYIESQISHLGPNAVRKTVTEEKIVQRPDGKQGVNIVEKAEIFKPQSQNLLQQETIVQHKEQTWGPSSHHDQQQRHQKLMNKDIDAIIRQQGVSLYQDSQQQVRYTETHQVHPLNQHHEHQYDSQIDHKLINEGIVHPNKDNWDQDVTGQHQRHGGPQDDMERDFIRYLRTHPKYQSLVQIYQEDQDRQFMNQQGEQGGVVYNHTEFNLHVDVFPSDEVRNHLLKQYLDFKRWQKEQRLLNNDQPAHVQHQLQQNSGIFNQEEYDNFLRHQAEQHKLDQGFDDIHARGHGIDDSDNLHAHGAGAHTTKQVKTTKTLYDDGVEEDQVSIKQHKEVETKKSKESSKKGKKSEEEEKGKKSRKGKGHEEKLALFELDELDEMGAGMNRYTSQEGNEEFKSITIIVLLSIMIALSFASFKAYQQYMKEEFDEKRVRFFDFEHHEERAYNQIR
eukprot:403369032